MISPCNCFKVSKKLQISVTVLQLNYQDMGPCYISWGNCSSHWDKSTTKSNCAEKAGEESICGIRSVVVDIAACG